MTDVRLIERWLPIAALGLEGVRERTPMTPYPAPNRLHVWWARRPLVSSRAAILACMLPESADRGKFLKAMGIHGDPVEGKRLIQLAKKTGVRVTDPYGYPRAYNYSPSEADMAWLNESLTTKGPIQVLDVTAGGGTIPLEAARLGFTVHANDLNPVASLLLHSTVRDPIEFGEQLTERFDALATTFKQSMRNKVGHLFPQDSAPTSLNTTYVWCRTAQCPYCDGEVPLAPSWSLDRTGVGILLKPLAGDGDGNGRICEFEIVSDPALHSPGTISGTEIKCPFADCGRVIDLKVAKEQGEFGGLGDAICAVVAKRRVTKIGKTGKSRDGWEKYFRPANASDNVRERVAEYFENKLPEWEALNCIPSELLPVNSETWTHGNTPAQYGARKFTDLFSKRQLITHCTALEIFHEMVADSRNMTGELSSINEAAFVLVALSIDRMIDWNSRQCTWDLDKQSMAHTFQVHAFPIRWSYAEMDPVVPDLGYDWAFKQTSKCISELVQMTSHVTGRGGLFSKNTNVLPSITNRSASDLPHIQSKTIDAIIMDPPYGANVMYSELSDFFYVWLKRTAGTVRPGLFTRSLTDGDQEAVTNKAKFVGQKGSMALANRAYQEKMNAIFAECRRVLKLDGIMTVMFTHKDAGAWDALTKGLLEAGFIVSASWPINTEAEGSTHIKNKAAANSTIFLVCRPKQFEATEEVLYWEDVEPLVAQAVRTRVEEFQKAGIAGVDLYLASFGPALEEFSRHWPLKRGTPRPEPLAKKRRKQAELFEEQFDPYAVTPEDALDAARREVKTWRLNKLTHMKGRADLDPVTSWFVLAWDAFKAPAFSYDEGLRLARAVGADLEAMIGRVCEKKGSDIKLWDSATRAAKGSMGESDGSRSMIDAIHAAAYRGRSQSLDSALDLLKANNLDNDPQFFAALEAMLEVLPPSKLFIGFDVAVGDAKQSADDFEVLEKLRRLAFSDHVDEPEQLILFAPDRAAAE